jgi:hypothetical protein
MTSRITVVFHQEPDSPPDLALRRVKEQHALARRAHALAGSGQHPDICFLYRWPLLAPQPDIGLSVVDERSWEHDPLATCGLTIVAAHEQGRLSLTWHYYADRYQSATVAALAAACDAALTAIITYPRTPETHGLVPSDFPGAQISQPVLNQVLTMVHQRLVQGERTCLT